MKNGYHIYVVNTGIRKSRLFPFFLKILGAFDIIRKHLKESTAMELRVLNRWIFMFN